MSLDAFCPIWFRYAVFGQLGFVLWKTIEVDKVLSTPVQFTVLQVAMQNCNSLFRWQLQNFKGKRRYPGDAQAETGRNLLIKIHWILLPSSVVRREVGHAYCHRFFVLSFHSSFYSSLRSPSTVTNSFCLSLLFSIRVSLFTDLS